MKGSNHSEDWATAAVLLASFILKLHHLGHRAITYWDESFHALVARNLLKHPFTPTLIDRPFLDYGYTDWVRIHIWLHKPILPLWQIAASYALLGFNTFALRFPSALLSTGAAGLTYLIGIELLDRRSAFIAALLQAFSPALLLQVHGYLFGDHIDTTLLFWTELGILFLVRAMRSGTWRDVLICGVAQGLAYLSKSYLAGIITCMALTAWLAPKIGLAQRGGSRLRGVHLLGLLTATAITIAPWTLWCYFKFPNEFIYEQVYTLRHLNSVLENWGVPWHRMAYDYLLFLYNVFYTPAMVALAVAIPTAFVRRDVKFWVVLAWAIGILVPHLLAKSRTPAATMLAIPAMLLLLGKLVSDALSGKAIPLAALACVLMMCLIMPPALRQWHVTYPNPGEMAAISDWLEARWVFWHLAVAALGAGTVLWISWRSKLTSTKPNVPPSGISPSPCTQEEGSGEGAFSAGDAANPMERTLTLSLGTARGDKRTVTRSALCRLNGLARVFVGMAMVVLTARTIQAAYAVTELNWNEPTYLQISEYARTALPTNAVLIFDELYKGENQLVAYRSFHTCYSLRDNLRWHYVTDLSDMAQRIRKHGGIPYLVSYRPQNLPVVFASAPEERTIYRLPQPPNALLR